MHAHTVTMSCILVALMACGDDVVPSVTTSTSSTSSGQSCQSSQGSLEGFIYQMGDSMPRPGALALVRRSAADTPLQVQADGSGHYQVTLDSGEWLVDGQEGDYCATIMSTPIAVAACGMHTLDLQLECVLGGGGAGGK